MKLNYMTHDISNLILNNNPKSLNNVTATTERSYICTKVFYYIKNYSILLYLIFFFFQKKTLKGS